MKPKSLVFAVLLLCLVLASLSTKIFQNVNAPPFFEPFHPEPVRPEPVRPEPVRPEPVPTEPEPSIRDTIPQTHFPQMTDLATVHSEKLKGLFHDLDEITKSIGLQSRHDIWNAAYDFGDKNFKPILDKVASHFLLILVCTGSIYRW